MGAKTAFVFFIQTLQQKTENAKIKLKILKERVMSTTINIFQRIESARLYNDFRKVSEQAQVTVGK